MGILLSKPPEQASRESSITARHGGVKRSCSANSKRKRRDREGDGPAKSRKKSNASQDRGTVSQHANWSYNVALSASVATATASRTIGGQMDPSITYWDPSTASKGHGHINVSRLEKKTRRKKQRNLENMKDSQNEQPVSLVDPEKPTEQEQESITPTTPIQGRRKRKSPTSTYFRESSVSAEIEQNSVKKKSKISVIETRTMPSSLPHFRPTSPDEFGLIQEKLQHDPWRMLVAVIFLNVTTAKMALPLLSQLFERWPTPEVLSKGLTSTV